MRKFPAILAAAGVAGTLSIAAARPAHADAGGVQLTFQARAPQPTVARTRITLETTGAVAGHVITVHDGANTASVPIDGTPTTVGLDMFTANVDASNPSAAVITINRGVVGPSGGADGYFCALVTGNVEAKSYTLDLANITGYRLTNYSADAYLDGALPYKGRCQCLGRRVASNGATLTPVALSGTVPTNLGRHPMKVVLVLDKSGSMSLTMPDDTLTTPPPIPTRWGILSSAVQQFIEIWKVEGAGVGGTGLGKDQLGLLYFSSTTEPGAITMVDRATAGGWTNLANEVAGKTPGGATALGPGLVTALNFLETSGVPQGDRIVVLLSDGIQNVAPLVDVDAEGYHVLPFDGTLNDRINKKCTPVITMAMGRGGGLYEDLLAKIAEETGVTNRITPSGPLTDAAFADALVQALKGNTLSTLVQRTDTLTNKPALIPVEVDGTIKHLIATLSWPAGRARGHNEGDPSNPFLYMAGPDGKGVKPSATSVGPNFNILRFDVPASAPPGSWQLQVGRGRVVAMRPDARFLAQPAPTPPIPYQVSVYAEERSLDFQIHLVGSRHATGEPLRLVVDIGLDGKPVTSAGTDITLRVDTPGGALGTELHNREDPGGPAVDPDATGNAYLTKIQNLQGNSDFLDKTGMKAGGDVLKLTATRPGQYAVTLNDTKLPGNYRFHFGLELRGPKGSIRRIENIDTQVAVNPDPANTEVKIVKSTTAPGHYDVLLSPRDKFGNYVGPGYDSRVKVRLDGAGTVGATVDPKTKGDYSVPLDNVPDGSDPVVHVSVTEKEIASAPLSKFVGGVTDQHWLVNIVCCPVQSTSSTALPAPKEFKLGMGLLLAALGLRRWLRKRGDDTQSL